METYTIEQIEKALWNCDPESEIMDKPGDRRADLIDQVKRELTRPKFSEGQVVCAGGDFCLYGLARVHGPPGVDIRPLNQSEVGPDWVPVEVKEAAMKLRDAMMRMRQNELSQHPYSVNKALAEFDEVVK